MFLYVSLEDSWDSSASASWAWGNAHLSPGLTHFLSFHLKETLTKTPSFDRTFNQFPSQILQMKNKKISHQMQN